MANKLDKIIEKDGKKYVEVITTTEIPLEYYEQELYMLEIEIEKLAARKLILQEQINKFN